MKKIAICSLLLTVGLSFAYAGVVNPDCTPEKAAKSAAAKSTVGVGGRCDPKQAATDSAKKATGVDDKKGIKKDNKKTDKKSDAKDKIKPAN